jgi:O-antigen/teichoic acid export membrane protein
MVVYGAGQFLSRLLSFLLLPLYTRKLTPADYGTLQLVMLIFEVVALIAGSRIAAGVFRLYYRETEDAKRHAMLSTAFILVNGSYVILGLVVLAFAPVFARLALGSDSYASLVRLAAGAFIFQGTLIVPTAFYKLREQPWRYVGTTVGVQALQAMLNILFVGFLGLAVRGVFLSSLLAFALFGTVSGGLLLRWVGHRYSRPAAYELLRFGLPLVATSGAVLLMTTGGRYALEQFGTLTDVGLFALATTFGIVLVNLGNAPFMQVWEAARFRIAQRPDRDALYARAFVLLNVSLFLVATAIAIFVHDYLAIAAAPAYGPVAQLVPLTLAAYLMQCWTMIVDTGVLLADKTSAIARSNWLAALVSLAGFVTLVPEWKTLGAAITLLLAFGVRFLTVYWSAQRLTPIRYQWAPVWRMAAGSVVAVALGALVHTPARALSLLAHALIYAGFIAWLWISNVVAESDRARARELLRALLRRRSQVAVT